MARSRYERYCGDGGCSEGMVADDLECLLRAAVAWRLSERARGVREARDYLKHLTPTHALSLSQCRVCRRRGLPLETGPSWLLCPTHKRLECDSCRCFKEGKA